ncbi:hypothetical protein A0128_11235 [Leptospira tipperaryensis]|uniref:Uncharacterized protein n=1 Tax=Leptospira tipperaryensis TaxID=2564040 RepID=A0A1D7UXQ4_9LEPT|nr:hypothetical protein A0128_11235 [Leptospira tipperaryensis]
MEDSGISKKSRVRQNRFYKGMRRRPFLVLGFVANRKMFSSKSVNSFRNRFLFLSLFFLIFSCSSGNQESSKENSKLEPKEDPCLEDRKKFCENQPSRRGITRECLSQNAFSLSPNCKAYLLQKGKIR